MKSHLEMYYIRYAKKVSECMCVFEELNENLILIYHIYTYIFQYVSSKPVSLHKYYIRIGRKSRIMIVISMILLEYKKRTEEQKVKLQTYSEIYTSEI